MIKHVKGDLIKMAKNGDFDVIIHGCNVFCVMGAGIALQIKNTFPEAYEADLKTARGDVDKVGKYSYASHKLDNGKILTIINAYTQYNYGGGGDLFAYDAFRAMLKQLMPILFIQRIGMPLIGCGLAGGDMDRILSIIEETIGKLDVTIVEYQK